MAKENKFEVLEEVYGKRVVVPQGGRKLSGWDSSIILHANMSDADIKNAVAKGVPIEGHFGGDLEALKKYQSGILSRQSRLQKPTKKAKLKFSKKVQAEKKPIPVVREGLSNDQVAALMVTLQNKGPEFMKATTVEQIKKIPKWEAAAKAIGIKDPTPEKVLEVLIPKSDQK